MGVPELPAGLLSRFADLSALVVLLASFRVSYSSASSSVSDFTPTLISIEVFFASLLPSSLIRFGLTCARQSDLYESY